MENSGNKETGAWMHAEPAWFWGEIARGEHVLQTYDRDEELIDSLFTFADDGLRAGETVMIIANPEHKSMLDERLKAAGHSLFNLILRDQYICLDAASTLSEFMIDNSPDPILFRLVLGGVIKRAKRNEPRLRAFGEMVALLWARGNEQAAIKLEGLWNDFLEAEALTLLCAYPSTAAQDQDAFMAVRHKHSQCLWASAVDDNKLKYRAL